MNPTLISIATVGVVILLALVAVTFTGWLSERRERTIKIAQESAGIVKTDVIQDSEFQALLNDLQLSATESIRVMAVSGRVALLDGSKIAAAARRGIRCQILLVDPTYLSSIFDKNPYLKADVQATIAMLHKVRAMLTSDLAHNVEIRLHSTPQMFFGVFVDDHIAAVSSYLPVPTSRPLYLLRSGENSMYTLFDAAFRFLWEHGTQTTAAVDLPK